MEYVSVGPIDAVAPGTMTGVEVAGEKVLLANVGGTVYAIQRKCPHMGFDLCKGRLHGTSVTCRMHGATFDLTTGAATEKAKLLVFKTQPKPAKTYPVTIEGGQILVGTTAP